MWDVIFLKRKKRRIKWCNLFLFITIAGCFTGIIISSGNILKWYLNSKKVNKQLNDIEKKVTIEKINEENTKTTQQEEQIETSDPYWDYIKMNLIDVDFSELKRINSNTVGWIEVNGTNINYPFVQTKNNSFYLTHSFDRSYNEAGWVFLDYRNNIKISDKNTIIYAHGRLDNTMFGSLRKVLTSGWLDDKNNYVIRLSTDKENTLWQVFSVYRIPTTSDYLQIDFKDDENFLEFANILLNRSAFDFKTKIDKNDKILTLSTCYNDNDKVVLHAKLIKINQK